MKIVVLGGCGAQGMFATREFAAGNVFDEVIIGDINLERAGEAVKELGSPKVFARKVDVFDKKGLLAAIADADLVANCTGPYYLTGAPVIAAAIEAGKNYIDFCDDIMVHEAVFTEENLRLAKEKGITVLIGMGCSPGIIPLMIMNAASQMDEVLDVCMPQLINDREPEGPAAVFHIIENFFGKVPAIKDGKRVEEDAFEGEEIYDFGPPLGQAKVSTFGHPEIFTLPRVLPGIKNLNIKIGTYPVENYELLKLLSQLGLASKEPMMVKGKSIAPRDFLITFLMNMPHRTNLVEGEPETVTSSAAVDVKGKKDGKEIHYKLYMCGQMGPATGIPLAIGADMIAGGKIKKKGLMTPEECIDPKPFIEEWIKRCKKSNYPLSIKETVTTITEWC